MKKNIAIIFISILINFVSIFAQSGNNEDEFVIGDSFNQRTKNNAAISFGFDVAKNELQNTCGIDLSFYYYPDYWVEGKDSKGLWMGWFENKWYFFKFEHNLFGFDEIKNDIYNNGKYNRSYFQCFSFPLLLTGMLTDVFIQLGTRRYNDFTPYATIVSYSLLNPQINFGYLQLGKDAPVSFNSMLYYRHKIDYFSKNENDFWRFKVGGGLSFELIANYNNIKSDKEFISLKFDIGYDKIFDYALDDWHTSKWLPTFRLNLAWGHVFTYLVRR